MVRRSSDSSCVKSGLPSSKLFAQSMYGCFRMMVIAARYRNDTRDIVRQNVRLKPATTSDPIRNGLECEHVANAHPQPARRLKVSQMGLVAPPSAPRLVETRS